VLGLFPYFGPEVIGGAQTSAEIAWDAVVKHAGASATLVSYASNNGVTAGWTSPGRLIVNSKSKAVYAALTKSWNQDLIFVWHIGLLKLLPFFRLTHARVVAMLLGIEAWRVHDRLTQNQMDKVDLYLTISDHTWQDFIEINRRYRDKQHQTVLLGLGEPMRGPLDGPMDNITRQPQRPVAAMISRLTRGEDYKGHREVIRAWPLILRRQPEAELWIIGEGDLRADLEKLVSDLRLTGSVRFLGQVSEAAKQELLEQSRCLLMPSRGEGFGLVYLEAMRVGRPCLVSTMDAGREVVNPPQAGLAANPDNQEELVNAVCRLLGDGAEWQEWSAQARRRYEQNYTSKHFQHRLLSALFPEQQLITHHS
jgi:glycosyltransferase involved in cell wall biosynthesis